MAEDVSNNLSALGTASQEDLSKALEGRPENVNVSDQPSYADRFFRENDDGTVEFISGKGSARVGMDVDQFEDKHLLGIRTVKGLDQGSDFTNWEDTHRRSQEAQSIGGKITNGLVQFGGETAINVAQALSVVTYGLGAGLVNFDLTKVYDNSVSNALDKGTDFLNEQFEIKKGGDGITEFLMDDLLGGVSFVAGAVLAETALTALTVATFGGAAPIQAAVTAGLAARAASTLKKAVSGGRALMGKGAVKGATALSMGTTRVAAGEALKTAGKQALKTSTLGSAATLGRQLISGAGMEAGMEARHMMNEAGEEHKEAYEAINGPGSFTEEQEQEFRQEISGYGDALFGVNMALVGFSNMLMFPKIFGVGLKPAMRTALGKYSVLGKANKFVKTSSLTAKQQAAAAKHMGIDVAKLPKLLDKARGTRTGRNWRRSKMGRIGLYEGFVEEGGQGTFSRSAKDYIAHKYDPSGQDSAVSYVDSFLEGVKGSYGTKEGFKEIGIGLLLGTFGIPNIAVLNTVKVRGEDGKMMTPSFVGGVMDVRRRQKEEDGRIDKILAMNDTRGGIMDILKHEAENHATQFGLKVELDEAVEEGNFKQSKDIESDMMFSFAASKILTGRFEDSIQESKEALADMSAEDYRKLLGEHGVNMTVEELLAQKTKNYDSFAKRMQEVKKSYEEVGEIYRGDNKDVQTGIANLLYNLKDRDRREKVVADAISEKIESLGGGAIIDATRAQQAIKLRNKELDALIAAREKLEEETTQDAGEDALMKANRKVAGEINPKIEKLQNEIEILSSAIKNKAKKSAKYNYDAVKFRRDLAAMIELRSAINLIDANGESIDLDKIIAELNDLGEISFDREKLIDTHNDFIKEGGYERFVAGLNSSIAQKIHDKSLTKEEAQKEIQTQGEIDASNAAVVAENNKDTPEDTKKETPVAPTEVETLLTEEQNTPEDTTEESPIGGQALEPTPGIHEDGFDISVDNRSNLGIRNIKFPGARDMLLYGVKIGDEMGILSVKDGWELYMRDTQNPGKWLKVGFQLREWNDKLLDLKDSPVIRTAGEESHISQEIVPVRVTGVEEHFGGVKRNENSQVAEKDALTLGKAIQEDTELVTGYVVVEKGLYTFRQRNGNVTELTEEQKLQIKNFEKEGQTTIGRHYAFMKDHRTQKMVYVPLNGNLIDDGTRDFILQGLKDIISSRRSKSAVISDNRQRLIDEFPDMVTANDLLRAFSNFKSNEATPTESGEIFVSHEKVNKIEDLVLRRKNPEGDKALTDVSTYRFSDVFGITENSELTEAYKEAGREHFIAWASGLRNSITDNQGIILETEGISGEKGMPMGLNADNGKLDWSSRIPLKEWEKGAFYLSDRIPIKLTTNKGAPVLSISRIHRVTLGAILESPKEGESTTEVQEGGTSAKIRARQADALKEHPDDDGQSWDLPNKPSENAAITRAVALTTIPGVSARATRDTVEYISGTIALLVLDALKSRSMRSLTPAAIRNSIRPLLVGIGDNFTASNRSLERQALGKALKTPGTIDTLIDMALINMIKVTKGTITTKGATLEALFKELTAPIMEEVAEEVTGDEAEAEDFKTFEDKAAFTIDPHTTAQFKLKLELLTMQYSEGSSMPRGVLGPKSLNIADFLTAMNHHLHSLPATWEALHEVLERESKNFPEFEALLDYFKGAEDKNISREDREHILQVRQQFITYASKSKNSFIDVKATPKTQHEISKLQLWFGNPSVTEKINLKQFANRLFSLGVLDMDENGNLKLDADKIGKLNEVLREITAFDSESTLEERKGKLARFLTFGMGIPVAASFITETNFPGIDGTLMGNKKSVRATSSAPLTDPAIKGLNSLEHLMLTLDRTERLLEDVSTSGDAASQAEIADDFRKALFTPTGTMQNTTAHDMFSTIARNSKELSQRVMRDSKGNNIYLYGYPKYLTDRIREIKEENSNNPLVFKDNKLKDEFDVDYVGNLSTGSGKYNSRELNDMADPDVLLYRLAMYLNRDGKYTDKERTSRHFFPKLADKSTQPILQVPALQQNPNVVDSDLTALDIKTFFDPEDLVMVFNKYHIPLIRKEFDRVKSHQESTTKANRFILYPDLNRLIVPGKPLLWDDVLKAGYDSMVNRVTTDLQNMVDTLAPTLFEYDKEGKLKEVKILNPNSPDNAMLLRAIGYEKPDNKSIALPEQKNILVASLAKFVLQEYAVNKNIAPLFLGDLSAMWKGSVEATQSNIKKRLALLVAPREAVPDIEGDFLDADKEIPNDPEIQVLVIDDAIAETNIKDIARGLGISGADLKVFDNIEATDGAVWVTPKEWLRDLLAQGKINASEFEILLEKALDPDAKFTRDNLIDWGVTGIDVKTLFAPRKPVITGLMPAPEGSSDRSLLYVKFAAFPMFASFVKGTDIVKLYDYANENGIGMIIHQSAIKIGSPVAESEKNSPTRVYRKGGKIDVSGIEENQIFKFPRSFYGIQQSVPVSKSDLKTHGSQTAKMVMVNLTGIKEKAFTIGEDDYNGQELYDFYMEARQQEIDARIKIFAKNYGLDVQKVNGGFTLSVPKGSTGYTTAMAARIRKEAHARAMGDNVLAQTYYDEAMGQFATPLWASSQSKAIDSLVVSIFKKELLSPKIAGFAGPIRPETGIGRSLDSVTEEESKGIVWIGEDRFDGEKFKPLEGAREGKPDQILMPWKFKGRLDEFRIKDKDGNLTNKLDMKRLPKELLNVFAYRIPSQLKASTGSFEIVGFLPESMGDTLIVPAELVGRIGQDYDIDKMFGMMYSHKRIKADKEKGAKSKIVIIREDTPVEEGGELQHAIDVARNAQVDVYHASLRSSNEEVLRENLSPVTDGYATELAEIIAARRAASATDGSVGRDLFSLTDNMRSHNEARNAAESIGVFASHEVLSAQFEQSGSDISFVRWTQNKDGTRKPTLTGIVIKENPSEYMSEKNGTPLSEQEHHRLGKKDVMDRTFLLQGYSETPNAGTVHAQNSRLVNHAVDNGNSGLLSDLGINKYTYALYATLSLQGYNQETIAMMANHPVVLEAIESIKSQSSLTAGGFAREAKIIQELIDAKKKEIEGELNKKRNIDPKFDIALNKKTLHEQFMGTVDFTKDDAHLLDALHSIHVLEAYQTAFKLDKDMVRARSMMKYDTKAPTKRTEFFTRAEEIRKFLEYQRAAQGNSHVEIPLSTYGVTISDVDSFLGSTVSGQVFITAQNLARTVLGMPTEYIDGTPLYRSVMEALGSRAKNNMDTYISGLKKHLNALWAEDIISKDTILDEFPQPEDGKGKKYTAQRMRLMYMANKKNNIAAIFNRALKAKPALKNNVFIQHLIPRDTKTEHGFYALEFNGGTDIFAEGPIMNAAFLELVQSTDPEIQALVKHLLLYNLVTGGEQSSKGYSNYITPGYLQSMGQREAFDPSRSEFTHAIGHEDVSTLHDSIVMHNPTLAPSNNHGEVKNGSLVVESYKLDSAMGFIRRKGKLYKLGRVVTSEAIAKKENPKDEDVEIEISTVPLILVEIRKGVSAPISGISNYITSYYSSSYQDRNDDGGWQDVTMPVALISRKRNKKGKGQKGGSKGNFLTKDFTRTPEEVGIETVEEFIEENNKETGSIDGPNREQTGEDAIGTQEDSFDLPQKPDPVSPRGNSGIYSLEQLIDKAFTGKKSILLDKFLAIEAHIADNNTEAKPLVIEVVENFETGGRYNLGTHTLQLSASVVANKDLHTVVHELIHAYTAKAISTPSEQSTEIQEEIKKLHALRNEIAHSPEILAQMGLSMEMKQRFNRGHVAYMKKNRNEALNEEQQGNLDFFLNNLDTMYGLLSTHEFISEALTNPVFAAALNKIKISKDRSVFTRIQEFVASILSELGLAGSKSDVLAIVIAVSGNILNARAKEMGLDVDFETKKIPDQKGKTTEETEQAIEDIESPLLDSKDLPALVQHKTKRLKQLHALRSRLKNSEGARRAIDKKIAIEKSERDLLVHSAEGKTDDSVSSEVRVTDVVTFATRELDSAELILGRVKADGISSESQSVVQDTLSILEFYSQIRSIQPRNSSEREIYSALQSRASNLLEDFIHVSTEIMQSLTRDTYAGTPAEGQVTSESFQTMSSPGWAGSIFMEGARQGNVEFAFLDGLIKQRREMQRQDSLSRDAAYGTRSAEFKQGAYFKKYGWEGIYELDADGNPSGSLLGVGSGTWAKAKSAAWKAANGDSKAYGKWIEANTVNVNLGHFFAFTKDADGEFVVSRKKDNPIPVAQLEKKVGKYGVEEFMERQEILLNTFLSDRLSKFDAIDISKLSAEDKVTAKNGWDIKHNPIANSQARQNKKVKSGTSFKYMLDMPLREKGGRDTGYYDSRYNEMMGDPAAAEYVSFLKSQFKDMMSMLPFEASLSHRDKQLAHRGMFVPSMAREEALSVLNSKGRKAWKTSILESITTRESEMASKKIDPVTGETHRSLRVDFINPLKEGVIREHNMDNMFGKFVNMAIQYHHMNQIEDVVLMTEAVMERVSIKHDNPMGHQIMSAVTGRPLASRHARRKVRVANVMNTIVDGFYGKNFTENVVFRPLGKRAFSAEQKAEVKKYEDQIQELEAAYNAGTLSKDDYEETVGELKDKQNAVKSYLDASKMLRGITKYVQMLGMAWNVGSATTNLAFGTLSVMKHAQGRADFSEDDVRQAYKIMLSSSLNQLTLESGLTETAMARKISGAMLNYDVLKDYTETQFNPKDYRDPTGKLALKDLAAKKIKMYEMQRSSEFFVYGLGMVAHLRSVKVNGVSLWDSMDANGVIQLEGHRPGEAKHHALMQRMDAFNKRIHGNYDFNSPIRIKKTLLGPLIMQFRSWLPEAVATRFESKKFDYNLMREVEGSVVSVAGNVFSENWKFMLKKMTIMMVPFYNGRVELEGLSALDQENTRKFMASARQIAGLYIMIMILRSLMDDEEDETTRRGLKFALNIAHRVENDLVFFISPNSAMEVVKSPAAILSLMTKLGKFFDATAQTVGGEPYIPTGLYAGDSRLVRHTGHLIPLSNAWFKAAGSTEQVHE